jgi:hypothetical protein
MRNNSPRDFLVEKSIINSYRMHINERMIVSKFIRFHRLSRKR